MGFEPTIEVLQTSALPLGYVALTFGILAQSVCLVKPMGATRKDFVSRDLFLQCVECGTQFVWTVDEQTEGASPTLCPGCRKLAPASGRQRGLVKWYSRGKGYGFITPAVGPDVFVHKSGLDTATETLRVGQLVEFGVSQGARGMQAEQVVVLEVDEGPKTKDE